MPELHQGTRWIMRVSRLRETATKAGLGQFEEAFTDLGLTPSASRLSRWEYGRSPGSARVLQAYETGAGLPRFLLFALNDRCERAATGVFAERSTMPLTDLVTSEDIYRILDAVVDGSPVSGSDWYLLASHSSEREFLYLSPANTALLARRLLHDLTVSVHAGYVLRFEALHLLIALPRIHAALQVVLEELLVETPTGFLGEAVSVLLRSRDVAPQSLTRALRTSASRPVQDGVRWLEDLLADQWIREEDPSARPDDSYTAPLLDSLPRWARLHIEEDVAARLVRTAIHHRSRLARHEACTLLMLAGVTDALTDAVLDGLEKATDLAVRVHHAQLLEYLVPVFAENRVQDLAVRATRNDDDPEVVRALWNARGHGRQPVALDEEIGGLLHRSPHADQVMAALGLSGALQGPSAPAGAVALPPSLEPLAAWWRTRGPALPL